MIPRKVKQARERQIHNDKVNKHYEYCMSLSEDEFNEYLKRINMFNLTFIACGPEFSEGVNKACKERHPTIFDK